MAALLTIKGLRLLFLLSAFQKRPKGTRLIWLCRRISRLEKNLIRICMSMNTAVHTSSLHGVEGIGTTSTSEHRYLCWLASTNHSQKTPLERCSQHNLKHSKTVHHTESTSMWTLGISSATRKDAQLSQRDCTAKCVIVFAWETIFYGPYKSILNHYWPQNLSNLMKKTQNKGYYGVQGHRGRYQSKVRMRLPISDWQ